MKQPVKKLKPDVARKYQLGTHHTLLRETKLGDVDLCQINLEQADKLTASGNFPYLVLKPKPVRKKKV